MGAARLQANTDDRLTVFAIAILAGCIATAAHEAVGHGTACIVLGGTITRLTSVYFNAVLAAHGLLQVARWVIFRHFVLRG